jgi:hypothetical protein
MEEKMRLDMVHRITGVHPLNRRECMFPSSQRYSARLKGAVENLAQKQGDCDNLQILFLLLCTCVLSVYATSLKL